MNLPGLYYTISPRVFAVGTTATVTFRGLRAWARRPSNATQWGRLVLRWIQTDGLLADGTPAPWNWFNEAQVEATDDPDTVRFTLGTDEEGEISCQLRMVSPENAETLLASFSLYALKPDLLALRPWRGDLHCHSSWSRCGNQDENPYTVAVCAREKGLDFMALTDHLQMKPSRRAARFFGALPTDFVVAPGEEIHVLKEHTPTLDRYHVFWPYLHIVNFGGRQSVAAFMNEHLDELKAAWRKKADEMAPDTTPELRYMMAASDWVFDKIREFGGLSVFCHPFWMPYQRFNLPLKVNEYILEQRKYDCMEVFGLGGIDNAVFVESNRLARAWWQEECVRRGLRVISSMGAADKVHPERLTVCDLSETRGCPLARQMRKNLRKRGIERGVICVYSPEPPVLHPDGERELPSERRPLGSLVTVTAAFGLRCAHLAIAPLLRLDNLPCKGHDIDDDDLTFSKEMP